MKNRRNIKKGNVVVMVAVLMPLLAGLGAFAIDVGYIAYSRSQLQTGADAAALAVVEELSSGQAAVDTLAAQYAGMNAPAANNLQVTVIPGTWDDDAGVFTPSAINIANSVRVTVLAPDTGIFFGSLLGKSMVDISASAVAWRPAAGIGTRFLIDDEMIDKDVPSIEALADSIGRDPEELVTPRGFNEGKQFGDADWQWEDNFLDLPAGATISLPTGQGTDYENNDTGMFDIDHPEFPFTDPNDFRDFLEYSDSGNDPTKWGEANSIGGQLDPLLGVSPVTDDSQYESYVDPDFVHVSPVTFSDLSTLNMEGGVPQINAQGLRRGWIAFKIIAVGNDIDGGGSVLPELVLEIVDPSTISIDDIKPPQQQQSGGRIRLVQ